MPSEVLMVWRKLHDKIDCHFNWTEVVGFNSKTRHLIENPSVPYAIRPIPHSNEIPLPSSHQLALLAESANEVTAVTNDNSDVKLT